MGDFLTLNAACRCKQLQLSVDVPASSLPLPMYLCHCNTCSAVSGQLCASVVEVPKGSKPWQITGEATGYNTSSALARYFCGKCGSSVYEEGAGMSPPAKYIDTGAFTQGEVESSGQTVPLFELKQQIFVADAKDGGMRDWLLDSDAWEGWNDTSKEIPKGSYYGPIKPAATPDTDDQLQCACKCGGVKFTITRPLAGSQNWSDPTEPETIASPVEIKKSDDWWKPRGKYNAFLCACNDCRFSSGNEVSAFAVIPKNNFRVDIQVSPENYKDLEAATTLRDHESSPGSHRQFCGRCGATLGFFTEKMPNVINVSVGLMQSATGPRCEDWLEWQTNGIGHQDLAQNKVFIDSLAKGYQQWGAQRAAAA